MLTPEYLQSVPDAMVELYAQAEADILADMARRINGFDMFIPSAQYQMQMLEEMGALRSDIVTKLSRLTGKSKKELTAIMREAGVETLAADEAIYKAAGLSSSPAAASSAVQEVLAAGLKKTNGLFTNLTKTTANTATKQFERALDRAYMQISSGAIDPATATKNAIKSLAKDGVGAITYPSGHVDSLEVAVRRATITGVNQTCLKVQEARADELGVDLVETTAHAGARPSHAEWQGQIFSRSGKSSKYPDFVQSTGYGTGAGLGGWNCNHSFRPYIDGMPRAYSKELLDSYAALIGGGVYATKGPDGLPGGKGNQWAEGVGYTDGPTITYHGVEYTPGANGESDAGSYYGWGGLGGGAAAGANGGDGERGYVDSQPFADGGDGGRGATPVKAQNGSIPGQGGGGGHGGGGGGGGGPAKGPSYNYEWYGQGGRGGSGGEGGDGASGIILIYY